MNVPGIDLNNEKIVHTIDEIQKGIMNVPGIDSNNGKIVYTIDEIS